MWFVVEKYQGPCGKRCHRGYRLYGSYQSEERALSECLSMESNYNDNTDFTWAYEECEYDVGEVIEDEEDFETGKNTQSDSE